MNLAWAHYMPGACLFRSSSKHRIQNIQLPDLTWTFTIAVVVFALSFIVAGRLQDKLGPFKYFVGGRDSGEPRVFPVLLRRQCNQVFRVLRSAWRIGQRVWLCDSDSRHVQVVPRQARVGGRAGGGWIRRGIGNLRPVGGKLPDSAFGWRPTFQVLGVIFFVMTMIGAFLLKNPPAGLQACRLDAGPALQIGGQQL